MMRFRPLPGLTAFTLVALALLIALGVWQLRRADEKRALIAAYEAVAASPPFETLQAPFCETPSPPLGRSALSPGALTGEEVRFYGGGPDGAAGWRLLRLAPAPDCSCAPEDGCVRDDLYLIVQSGFETLTGERVAPIERLMIAAPPAGNLFTPQNDPERGDFYRFDAAALARAFGVAPAEIMPGVWLPAASMGLPPALADMPPSRHMGYAVTWFGIAAALVGVYLAYHHRAGRFGR